MTRVCKSLTWNKVSKVCKRRLGTWNTARPGRIITQSELDDMKKAVPNLRLIQSRWVAAYKSSERVRTRIVAKDFNRGSSARSLGFSSSDSFNRECSFGTCDGSDTEDAFACIGRESCLHA